MSGTHQLHPLDRIADAGLYIAAFSLTFGIATIPNIGLVLALAACVARPTCWRWMSQKAVFWICVAACGYIAIDSLVAAYELPGTSSSQQSAALDWIRLLLFPPLAWHLSRNHRLITRLWIVFAAGVLAGTLIAIPGYLVLQEQIESIRFGGLINKPIVHAYYVATVFVGVMVGLPRWTRDVGALAMWVRALSALAIVLTLVILTWAFIKAGSRTPLLSLLAVAPVVLISGYRASWNGLSIRSRTLAILAVGTISAAVLMSGSINPRLQEAAQSIQQVMSVGLDNTPQDGGTIRLRMWRFGLEAWMERPWTGWGPGSLDMAQTSIGTLPLDLNGGKPWAHLHNAYVQVLFSFGLIGFFLLTAIFAILTINLARVISSGNQTGTLALFCLAVLISVLAYSLTNFNHLSHHWRTFWLLAAASSLALIDTSRRLTTTTGLALADSDDRAKRSAA